ncbi:hypothetical protein GCM10010300_46360 [Streptomyces olivaceoviridis]|nr:hypothetical protein GCM10010300_46360 [Streptomyces olivaceoviridis]
MNQLSTQPLLAAFGVLGLGAVMFAGTGLLDGFFLPDDSLLLTAGLPRTGTKQHGVRLSLGPRPTATAVGAHCGCLVGRRAGGFLPARSHSALPREGARRAKEPLVFCGHAKAIVPAGCVPVVRTVLSRSRRCPPGWSPRGSWSAAWCGASV